MNKVLTISKFITLLTASLIIAACGGDGGDGGDDNSGPGVPTNAVLIADSTTAETTVSAAVKTGTAYVSAVGIEASTSITGRDILNIVQGKIDTIRSDSETVATGVTIDEPCSVSGSVSGSETDTTFSLTFNECNDGLGFIIKGSVSGEGTSSASGPYTLSFSGKLTITLVNNSESIGFEFNFAGSGNDVTGAYTISTYKFSIAPSSGGGFLAEVTQSLVGNDNNVCELSSGRVLVTGAQNSQARGTVNPDATVKVEYHSGDGNFVESANSPLACLI